MPTTSKKSRKKTGRRSTPGPKLVRKGHVLVIMGKPSIEGDLVEASRNERIRELHGKGSGGEDERPAHGDGQ